MPDVNAPLKNEPTAEELVSIIFRYVGLIANERSIDKMLVTIADMGRDLVSADRCSVWLVDSEKNILWTKVAHGLERMSIPLTSGIAGNAVANNKSIIINDVYNSPIFDKTVDSYSGYTTNNIIAIPFCDLDENVIGVFQAVNKMTESGVFTDEDERRLMLAATYAGNEITAMIMRQELEQTQKEIIFTLAETVDIRSKETGNHVKRVAEYSYVIAKALGISESDAQTLKLASPMHDIGKVAIPDSVLLKPGKLTDKEFDVIREHAFLGYKILNHSKRKVLKSAAALALTHHERWDGKGYPYCTSGKDIHIFGRITAIADVFDALSSERAYKEAWELERVLEYIRNERGGHFDPEIVDVFFSNLDKILEIRDRYQDT